ncbi:MAG: methylenetetrahydrofolate reductase [Actinomycetota bacterium]|nr:methylenetetrahydrofolate reductase [Actinomycetota bacterium]
MSENRPGGRLAALLDAGRFCVTGEVVPPRSADPTPVVEQTRALVGYVDAVNVTDNPTASAHMSPLAGVRFVAGAGIEPTVQLTSRDRNRLGITSDLLGAWALGARNLLCLSGDPVAVGDHPDAVAVTDLSVHDVVRLARRMRDEGTTLSGAELASPPRYLIGVADMPLADPYDPARLEQKLDAGADFVMTQIAYDLERLGAWADTMRGRGLFERARVIVGVVPLRTATAARYIEEHLPGVNVPAAMTAALDAAGEDAERVGLDLTIGVVNGIRQIGGVAGIHLMAMGHDEAVRDVVEGAGLFPRPTAAF